MSLQSNGNSGQYNSLAHSLLLPLHMLVSEASQVGEARRRASKYVQEIGLTERERGKVDLVVTELAKNLIKHTPDGGELLLRLRSSEERSLEVLALDQGPGIRSVSQALSDGYSSAGSPGTGLGAVRRQADYFDLYSVTGKGTAVLARFGEGVSPRKNAIEVDGIRIPKSTESTCGDAWAVVNVDGRWLGMVVDGLGHGVLASEVAEQAVRTFHKHRTLPPDELLQTIHLALRSTRGGVAAITEISPDRKRVGYAGIGNISGVLHSNDQTRNMVSYNGTLGQEVRKYQVFDYEWTPETVLVMHSDGLKNRWELNDYPGLKRKSAILIAGVLYRDFCRGRDDVGVLVAKEASP